CLTTALPFPRTLPWTRTTPSLRRRERARLLPSISPRTLLWTRTMMMTATMRMRRYDSHTPLRCRGWTAWRRSTSTTLFREAAPEVLKSTSPRLPSNTLPTTRTRKTMRTSSPPRTPRCPS
ncbi:hypothetical protein HG530_011126, partial [Fusarium avenaceum]